MEKYPPMSKSQLEQVMLAGGVRWTPEELEAELAFHGNDGVLVLKGFLGREKAEEHKERGNAFFAKRNWTEAFAAYDRGRDVMLTLEPRSPLDRRLLAILHSNSAACFLAGVGKWKDEAANAARAAVAEDPTFEKAWLRLGAALEALGPAARGEALEAYRKVRTHATAVERIAVLEAPPILVTTEGLSGIAEGSLDLGRLAPFEEPGEFYGTSLFLEGEPLAAHEARFSTFDYSLRMLTVTLTATIEKNKPADLRRMVMYVEDYNTKEKAWLRLLAPCKTLVNVADDGRSRKVSNTASSIPLIVLALWTGKGAPSGSQAAKRVNLVTFDVKPFKALLLRNAEFVSEEGKRGYTVPPGFELTFLTHVAAPELDYSIHESCCAPGCTVECAAFRCGRCFVARYCGKEHMTAHWKMHKLNCVPLAQRQPRLELDCSNDYRDNHDAMLSLEWHCVPVPKKTFPGVVVVKVVMLNVGSFIKIVDSHGALVPIVEESSKVYARLRQLLLARVPLVGGCAVGYFDADLSVEGRLVVYFDHVWKCTW
jgi:hypothetical protein